MKTYNPLSRKIATPVIAVVAIVLVSSFVQINKNDEVLICQSKAQAVVLYTVDKSNENWVMRSTGGYYKVIFHSSKDHSPFIVTSLNPTQQLIIKPGQWVEIDLNNGYGMGLAKDADHR